MSDVILNGVDIKSDIDQEKDALEIFVSDAIIVDEVSMKAEIAISVFVVDRLSSGDKPHN